MGLEGHGLLNVAILVVDDGTVEAGSRELFNLELRNEVTVRVQETSVSPLDEANNLE